MVRALGVELRRSAAPLLGVVVLVIALVVLRMGPPNSGSVTWTRQWGMLAEWVRFPLMFSWPVVVGLGALQGLRDRRSGVEELFASTPRPRAHRALALLGALGIGVVTAQLVVTAIGAVRVDGYWQWSWLLVLLVGLVALVAAAWLGAGLARLVPSPLTPPVLAVGALVLVATALRVGDLDDDAPSGLVLRLTLLRPSTPSPRDVFHEPAGSFTLAQGLFYAGLALTAFLLLAARKWWQALLPVVLAAAVAVPLMPGTPEEVRVASAVAMSEVCTDSGPRVCLTRAHGHELAEVAGPAQEALRQLAKLPDPPRSVREKPGPVWSASREAEPTDVVWINLDELNYFLINEPARGEELTKRMVAGAGTRPCHGMVSPEDPTREIAARTVAGSWVAGRLVPLLSPQSWYAKDVDALVGPAWEALRALPEQEQVARVQAMRAVQGACSGDPLTALTSGAL
ncbi:hypothetical protein [Saccharothrix coeruleofusca]|uniref:Uncharacterized protein n=1 Tax=Saccharothrix coeruleofusca TaxID=33919 RepID=A0A918AQR9_9PSEU|nr:hypothetical protein [Saccharothrix coeruleofusca]GGP70662.1 hypothetical protein GCM10010185_49700 [Saccharothrix coeruleofusca]